MEHSVLDYSPAAAEVIGNCTRPAVSGKFLRYPGYPGYLGTRVPMAALSTEGTECIAVWGGEFDVGPCQPLYPGTPGTTASNQCYTHYPGYPGTG
eukprot:3934919-Rhodomonas_salina.3